MTRLLSKQGGLFQTIRLPLGLMAIVAIGLVAGAFTGKTIAGGDQSSPSIVSSGSGWSPPAGSLNTSSDPQGDSYAPPAKSEPPQIFEAPTSSEPSQVFETAQSFETPLSNEDPSTLSTPSGGSTPISSPLASVAQAPSPVYQVSRQVDASLTVEEGIIGDVNDDGIVNAVDLGEVAGSFDSIPGEPTPLDVNGDGRIDIFDLATVAAHQGEPV